MKNKAGFTLIEVLVALAILSIALTAIIKATSQNIKDTFYVQQKTFALWVGSDIMNEIQAGILKPSEDSNMATKEKSMFDEVWPYRANLHNTPNPHIKAINIEVDDPKTQATLIQLEGYWYAQ